MSKHFLCNFIDIFAILVRSLFDNIMKEVRTLFWIGLFGCKDIEPLDHLKVFRRKFHSIMIQ